MRRLKITFSGEWPPHTHAEGGQVEPVLGCDIAKLTRVVIPVFLNNHAQAWLCLGAIGHQDVERRIQRDISTTGMIPNVKVIP